MDKVILINKEKGYTSRDIVNIVSKKFKTKKVGHFGTLDPLATGLLIIGIGTCTKIGNYLPNDSKEYKVEVLVGTSTDTYDIEGKILEKKDNINLTKENLERSLKSMIGRYLQEVPIYSAVKVNGKKLYEYARSGEDVKLPKKEVTIYDIKDISIQNKNNETYFTFTTHVSKGTYIRSLINDLSKKLDIPLCMSNLIRTKQDKFSLKDANTLKDLEQGNYKLLDTKDVLDTEEKEVPKDLEKIIINGGLIPKLSNRLILFTKDGNNIALYGPYKENMKPYLTFKKDLN